MSSESASKAVERARSPALASSKNMAALIASTDFRIMR
jgi:hypothetical protein